MSALYIYGLTPPDADFTLETKAVSNPEGTITLVDCGLVRALVSPIDIVEILPVRRNMMAHTKALEAAMRQTTILPMQFGVIVDNPGTLNAIVEKSAVHILQSLNSLRGQIEVGLKITWDERIIFSEIANARPELQAKSSALGAKSEAETYYDRIDLGRKVDAAIKAKRVAEAERITDLVTPYASSVKALDIKDGMTVVNLALLVPHDNVAALEAALVHLDAKEGARLAIKYIAPVPPYNFVSLRLDFPERETPGQAA